MVKDVVCPVDLDEAAVGVAGVHAGVLHVRDPGQTDVPAAHQHTAVGEAPRGAVADGIAEVVAVEGTVNKIVFSVELPHGAGLPEGLSLVGSPFGLLPGEHSQIVQLVAGDHRQHIRRVQLKPHGPLFRGLGAVQENGIAPKREAGV